MLVASAQGQSLVNKLAVKCQDASAPVSLVVCGLVFLLIVRVIEQNKSVTTARFSVLMLCAHLCVIKGPRNSVQDTRQRHTNEGIVQYIIHAADQADWSE